MSDKPEELAALLERDRMFSRDAKGKPITRSKTCECGKTFTQRQLSERFMLIVERRGRRALEMMAREIPDCFVPVHCPPCESKDLGMQARRASYLNYTDRDEAAD